MENKKKQREDKGKKKIKRIFDKGREGTKKSQNGKQIKQREDKGKKKIKRIYDKSIWQERQHFGQF